MIPQEDLFSEFRMNQKQESPKSIHNLEKTENNDLNEFRINQAEGFPYIKETGRHAARITSRITETIGGIPGDIQSLIQSGVFAGLEKLTGHETPKEARKQAKEDRAPTSGELKEASIKHTKGFTAPQGSIEKNIDEGVEIIAGLLGPMKFRKSIGVGLAAFGAKKGTETLGLGESSQEFAKLGTMFLMTMFNPKGATKYATSQYEQARKLSKGSSIQTKTLESDLSSLKKDLEEGISTKVKEGILKPIDDISKKIQNGKIPVNDLTSAKRDISTLMGDPTLLKREKNLLKHLGKIIDTSIKPYEKLNPAFSKVYRPANEIYSAVMQGNKASNFIKYTLGNKSLLGAGLAEVALGHPEYLIPSVAGAAGAVGSAKTIDFFTRMAKSPELRKYYGKAMIAAAKEDAPSLRLYADKIEEIMEKN